MKWRKKSALLLAGFLVMSSFFATKAVAKDEKVIYGYATKDMKLYSIEIRDGKSTITLCDKDHPFDKPGFMNSKFIIGKSYPNANPNLYLADKTGNTREEGDEENPYRFTYESEHSCGFFNSAGEYSEGLMWVRRGCSFYGDYGYVDGDGKLVIPYMYRDADEFKDGLAIIANADVKYGVINQKNQTVIKPEYTYITRMKGTNLFKVNNGDYYDGNWGIVDYSGKLIVPCKYKEIDDFNEFGLAKVKKVGKNDAEFYGAIDKTGKEVIPCTYEYFNGFYHEGLVTIGKTVGKSFLYGVLDKAGKEVIPLKSEREIRFNKEGLALFSIRKKDTFYYGVYDKKGKVVIPAKYLSLSVPKEGEELLLAMIEKGYQWKYGYINKKGKTILPFRYSNATEFRDGLAGVTLSSYEKSGFIDKKGKMKIKSKYFISSPFSDGLAMVEKEGKYGYINKKGKLVIPFKFDIAQPFSEGSAVVTNYKKNTDSEDYDYSYMLIDKKGRMLTKEPYQEIREFNRYGLAGTEKGLIDRKGREIDLKGYQILGDFDENGLAIAYKEREDDRTDDVLINLKGEIVADGKIFDNIKSLEGSNLYVAENYEMDDGYIVSTTIKTSLINKEGKILSDKYYYIGEFDENGLALASSGTEFGYIDKEGKEVIPVEYAYIYLK